MTLGLLDRFRPRPDAPSPVVFEGLAQARAYWEGLRTPSRIPERKAVDPRGLVGVLERVFLAERIGRGLAQLRIAGSGLTEFAGTDVRGLPLSCLFGPESRGLLAETLEQVFTGPAVAELDLGSDRILGRALQARLLLLPLEDETGTRQILGVLGFVKASPAHCKLQILARREERLVLNPQPADLPAPEIEPIRRVGHLSLVHSAH
jgi:hypothetical protein